MGFFIGLLTFALVLDCLALILLVLMQLPKKDAGAGLAFGGGATDALFGAGSGNVLTKATKYAAAAFFVLAVIIGTLHSKHYHGSVAALKKAIGEQPASLPGELPPIAPPPSSETPVTIPPATNFTLETAPPVQSTPLPGTNSAPAP